MKRSRNSEGRVLGARKKAESGVPVGDGCRQVVVSAAPFDVLHKYNGLGRTELRELRPLREESSTLKRLVADLMLDRHVLQAIVRNNLRAERRRGLDRYSQDMFDLSVRRGCRLLQLRNAT